MFGEFQNVDSDEKDSYAFRQALTYDLTSIAVLGRRQAR